MTSRDFRRIALSLPETSESAHMKHPDFRVRGKIVAALAYPAAGFGMVKLTPEQQSDFVHDEPKMFAPVKGGWGRKGATNVILKSAKPDRVRRALLAAWRNVAPRNTAPKNLAVDLKE